MITVEKEYPLTDDLTFKYICAHQDILKYIVNLFLDYVGIKTTFEITNIKLEECMLPDKKNIKLFFGDITCRLSNGDELLIEMYRNSFDIEEYNKSYSYAARKYSKQIKKGQEYKNLHKIININLVRNEKNIKNKELVNEYVARNKEGKIYSESTIYTYVVRFDNIKDKPYNEEEEEFITLIRLINSKDREELNKYKGRSKMMAKIVEEYDNWTYEEDDKRNSLERYADYIEEQTEARVRSEEKKIANRKINEERRIANERLQDAEINTAKSLLEKSVPIDIIEYSTKLPKQKILNLKKSLFL